jgi:uncharacterized protein
MEAETLLLALLVAQGVMGGVDTVVNHEMIERLPYRQSARAEIGVHAIRETIHGTLFGALAWLEWHGAFAAIIAALLLAEIAVTAGDEFIENRTRVLPQNERVLHVFLTLNLGLVIAVLAPILLDWASHRTGLVVVGHGILSLMLSAFSLAGFAWAVRDLLAWRRLESAPFLGA